MVVNSAHYFLLYGNFLPGGNKQKTTNTLSKDSNKYQYIFALGTDSS